MSVLCHVFPVIGSQLGCLALSVSDICYTMGKLLKPTPHDLFSRDVESLFVVGLGLQG